MLLTSPQLELLRTITLRGRLPRSAVDGRTLRALLSRGLAHVNGNTVRPTAAGAAALGKATGEVPAESPAGGGGGPQRLTEKQEDVLRAVIRRALPVLADHVDGRVLRALVARELVQIDGDWVVATDGAAAHLQAQDQAGREHRRRKGSTSPEAIRAEIVLRAVEQLEAATPADSVVQVAGHPAYADDLLTGLRQYARSLTRRA